MRSAAICPRICGHAACNGRPLKADSIIHKVLKHCRGFAYDTFGTLEKSNVIHDQIMRKALWKVNDHYKQEVLATTAQFEAAIDEAISEVQPDMKPLFGADHG